MAQVRYLNGSLSRATGRGSRARTLALVALASALLCVPEIVGATTITVSLPDLLGEYPRSGSLRKEIFSLGVEFLEVSEASLSLTFSALTGVFESCDEFGCTLENLFPGFLAFVTSPVDSRSLFPFFAVDSATDLVDANLEFFWPGNLDRLLDGSDHVGVRMESFGCVAANTCFFITQPSATITAASVSVTGTVVPEPSTLVLVVTGLLGLAAGRRHARTLGRNS